MTWTTPTETEFTTLAWILSSVFWDFPAYLAVEYAGPSSQTDNAPIKTMTISDLSPPFLSILSAPSSPSTLTTKEHTYQNGVKATLYVL